MGSLKHKLQRFVDFPISAFIVAVIIFLMTPPMFMWDLLKASYIYRLFLSFILLFTIFPHLNIKQKHSQYSIVLYIISIAFYITGDFSFFPLLVTCILTLIYFLDQLYVKKIFNAYVFLISLILIPSIIQFVLVLCGFDFPYVILEPYIEEKDYVYRSYTFFTVAEVFTIFPRFMAYFDEPGVLGSICAIVLYIRKYNLRDIINIPILISGILSFSLYFYIATFVFIFLYISGTKKIIVSVCLIFALIFLSNLDNDILNRYIFERIEYDETEGIAGNNRTVGNFDNWFKQYSKSGDAIFGYGRGSKQLYNPGGASYKDRIVEYGFLGFGIYLLMMILMGYSVYRKHFKTFLLFLFLYLSMLWQRPFIIDFAYMILFLFITFVLEDNTTKR